MARGIVDHLADEVVAFAIAAIRRLQLSRETVPVTLSGGLFRTRDLAFFERIRLGITAAAPSARISVLDAPPVIGAGLLGLDALAASAAAKARLRAGISGHSRE